MICSNNVLIIDHADFSNSQNKGTSFKSEENSLGGLLYLIWVAVVGVINDYVLVKTAVFNKELGM